MPGKKMTPKGLTPRQKMELKKGKGKKGISLKTDSGIKKLMGGGTMRKPMMAKKGKTVKIAPIKPKKGTGKAGTGRKNISIKGDSGIKKLRRGGKA